MPVACPKCNRNVPEKKACLYCGAPLPAAAPSPSHPPSVPAAAVAPSASGYVQGRSADTLLAEAAALAKEGKIERALAAIESALKLRPNDALILCNRGLLLADLLRFDEALKSIDRAIEIHPNLAQAIELRGQIEADPRRHLPPGRPGPTMIEMLADGGPTESFAMTASSAIHDPKRLARWKGPEEIAAMNWIVAVPKPRERAGRKWKCAHLAEAGLLFTMIGKDRSGYLFRYAPTGRELPDDLLPAIEIDALAAILEGGALSSVGVCANKPFGEGVNDRVRWVNTELDLLGVDKNARIELLVIDDGYDHAAAFDDD